MDSGNTASKRENTTKIYFFSIHQAREKGFAEDIRIQRVCRTPDEFRMHTWRATYEHQPRLDARRIWPTDTVDRCLSFDTSRCKFSFVSGNSIKIDYQLASVLTMEQLLQLMPTDVSQISIEDATDNSFDLSWTCPIDGNDLEILLDQANSLALVSGPDLNHNIPLIGLSVVKTTVSQGIAQRLCDMAMRHDPRIIHAALSMIRRAYAHGMITEVHTLLLDDNYDDLASAVVAAQHNTPFMMGQWVAENDDDFGIMIMRIDPTDNGMHV